MLQNTDQNNYLFSCPVVSDEAVFHINRYISRHNFLVGGSKNPHIATEHQRVRAKENVWCAVVHNMVTGPFFFAEDTIINTCYFNRLELYAVPKIKEEIHESHSNKMKHQHISV
jgi:hypothetical protein